MKNRQVEKKIGKKLYYESLKTGKKLSLYGGMKLRGSVMLHQQQNYKKMARVLEKILGSAHTCVAYEVNQKDGRTLFH